MRKKGLLVRADGYRVAIPSMTKWTRKKFERSVRSGGEIALAVDRIGKKTWPGAAGPGQGGTAGVDLWLMRGPPRTEVLCRLDRCPPCGSAKCGAALPIGTFRPPPQRAQREPFG